MHTANITKVQNTGQSRVTVNMTVLVIVIAFLQLFYSISLLPIVQEIQSQHPQREQQSWIAQML